jgi:hypothetical protein
MPYSLEIQYYNSFWLKHLNTPRLNSLNSSSTTVYSTVFGLSFPGIPFLDNSNDDYPNFPTSSSGAPKSNLYEINNVFDDNNGSNWIIEEARIRGGYNNTNVDYSPKAYLKLDTNDAVQRQSSLIYSGIYNSRTGFNQTNVFSVADAITKTVDPHNGSIQLIDALDNNLTIYQENKISQALIDKDAIYAADGAATLTKTPAVIGQVTPYVGDYGISRNPESFAKFGFRRYFADKDRNAVMRLSRDGLTPISSYGMNDFFRDTFSLIKESRTGYLSDEFTFVDQNPPYPVASPPVASFAPPFVEIALPGGNAVDIEVGSILEYQNTGTTVWKVSNFLVTGTDREDGSVNRFVYLTGAGIPITAGKVRFRTFKKDAIEGGYDIYKNNYILSIQRRSGSKTNDIISDYNTDGNEGYYSTLAFDETPRGWTTFYTYRPTFIFSLKNNFFTTTSADLYEHYIDFDNHNRFYENTEASSISLVLNDNPSLIKNFKTINYEGSNGWQVDEFNSDISKTFDNSTTYKDSIVSIKSYEEGSYTENGIPYRAGFYKKETKYYANLVNNNQTRSGEIILGGNTTGIKGYFATIKLSTDDSTSPGSVKELFSVGSEVVKSS